MMMVFKQKKLKIVLLTLLLLCAFLFLGVPRLYAFAESEPEDDYEAFYEAFTAMVGEYDIPKDDGIAVMRMGEGDDFDPGYQTRLIVTTDEKIDDFGAVASCHYKNHYYFQYEDYYETDMAYEHFSALDNVSVMYDYKTALNGDTIEINASSYNSWGWNAQTDYTGANSYLTTLLETVGKDNLNGQVVAVVDTGINPDHILFKDRILTKFARNYVPNASGVVVKTDYIDAAGHGSHVSGTIAEITPSSVKILPLRVLDAKGEGLVSYITGAIDYATRVKSQIENETGCEFKIMNMSLGITDKASINASDSNVSANAISYYDLSAWIEEAYSKGILTVASAGNTEGGGRLIYSSPANVAHAITVTALTRTYTNSAPLMYDFNYSDYGPTVDFAAPGSVITSAGHIGATSTATMSGTSMAAPHVSAIVALIYLHPSYKNLSFEQLNTLLQENADRSMIYQNKYALSATAVRNNYYGYGIINIKNVGMLIEGAINFSGVQFSDTAVNVKLFASTTVSSGQTLEIYYTTDETATSVSSSDLLYNSSKGINVKVSTRILAAAFVKQNGVIAKRSEVVSKVFYISNQDLQSRFKVTSGTITQYTGTELTKLVVPSTIGGSSITTIGSKAFNDSPVQNLTLPSTISLIGANAFDTNSKLKEIHCASANVEVGNYAFQRCANLSVVDIPNIKSLGQLAFAYSSSISDISLLKVEDIGKNAFSASSLNSIIIGKSVKSIGSHTQMSLQSVFGYAGTVAESFADANNADFYDLTVRLFENLPSQKVIREGSDLTFRVICAGFDVVPLVTGAGTSVKVEQSGDLSRMVFDFTISNLRTDTYFVKVDLRDFGGDVVSTNVMNVVVVPKSTESFTLNYNNAEYNLYIDGELVTDDVELFKGQNYTITYAAYAGYNINSVMIDGKLVDLKESELGYTLSDVKADVSISVNTIEEDSLNVRFNTEHGSVYIGGVLFTDAYKLVDRNSTLNFTLSSDEGWIVKRVFVDGKEISATAGVYSITNITSSKVVDVRYEEANYCIEITFVNSCGIYLVTGGGTLDNVAHGSSREITIAASDGFAIDFISIDGEIIDVKGGTFTIEGIDSDKEVVVSFKKEKVSIFKRDHSTILYYFIVLLVLFVLFVVGNIIMRIVRKKDKQD